MDDESLIRRGAAFAAEAAFAALLLAGLVLGADRVAAGVPRFLDAALPSIAAQATPQLPVPHDHVRLMLPDFVASTFAPQVLYPVTARPFPTWLTTVRAAHPVIAICIDDLGEDLAGTDKAMALPKPVALSFLPFADATPFLADEARRAGHEILAHVPMQAIGPTDPGPMALTVGMATDEVRRRLDWDIARVPGLVGINNHEGSRFTSDAAALAPVMADLKTRGLFFFDSRTAPSARGVEAAQAAGVMSAGRDIFLDDDQSGAAIQKQLADLVATAKRQGVAIAIGHPHDATLAALAAWLKQDHGVTLVTLSEAMKLKRGGDIAVAAR